MALLLSEWDVTVFDQVRVHGDWGEDESFEPPMPIFISMG